MDIPEYFTYFTDKPDIYDFSNPNKVQRNAFKILGSTARIAFSPRKNKKYVIINPETNKYVHFGAMDYVDYTKHLDKKRLEKFRSRNHKWSEAEPYTPAFLSYYLLWS